jgi:hypothetical protein
VSSVQISGKVLFSDHQIARCPDHPIHGAPTRPFSTFCCKQSAFLKSTPGSPLRLPWATLGPPKGHPIPRPSRQRVATDSCRTKYLNTNTKRPLFWASSQQPGASSFICQRPPSKGTLPPEVNIELYHLFACMSSRQALLLWSILTSVKLQATLPW